MIQKFRASLKPIPLLVQTFDASRKTAQSWTSTPGVFKMAPSPGVRGPYIQRLTQLRPRVNQDIPETPLISRCRAPLNRVPTGILLAASPILSRIPSKPRP
jgi:hypothetical protein